MAKTSDKERVMAKKLDRKRPFGEINGPTAARYEQDGTLFGADEYELDAPKNVAYPPKKTPPVTIGDPEPGNIVTGETHNTAAASVAGAEPLPFEEIPEAERTPAQKRARTMEEKRRAAAAAGEPAPAEGGESGPVDGDDLSAAMAG